MTKVAKKKTAVEKGKAETKKKSRTKTAAKSIDHTDKIKKLNKEIAELKKEIDDLKNKYLRTVAEFENYKKRKEREINSIIESANSALFLELLPILDDFERSLNTDTNNKSYESLRQGVELIYQKLNAVLQKQGLEPIEAVGQPFDPEFHEALMQVEDKEKDSNVVVQEAQKGYRLKDKIIRHAKVIVNK